MYPALERSTFAAQEEGITDKGTYSLIAITSSNTSISGTKGQRFAEESVKWEGSVCFLEVFLLSLYCQAGGNKT